MNSVVYSVKNKRNTIKKHSEFYYFYINNYVKVLWHFMAI